MCDLKKQFNLEKLHESSKLGIAILKEWLTKALIDGRMHKLVCTFVVIV